MVQLEETGTVMRSWHPPAWGNRGVLAAVAVTVTLAVQACMPASASTHVTSRYFGMHAPQLAGAFPHAPVGAVNLTTNGVYWPQLEPSAGHFDFRRLQLLVEQAHAHRARPLLVLGFTPRFHSTTPHHGNVAATAPEMPAWRRYVRHVVGRFGARLD